MKKYLSKVSLYLAFISIVSCVLIAAFMYHHNLTFKHFPAPRLSDSYSFNEKMLFLRNSEIKNPKVLAIGSSLSLNNFHSETILESFNTNSYLNASSWGMRLSESYRQLKSLLKIYNPEYLIIAITFSDFFEPDKTIDHELSEKFISSNKLYSPIYHLQTFSLQYYLEYFPYAKYVRTIGNSYYYLNFDKHGAVNFEKENFNITDQRWNHSYFEDLSYEYQLTYLDSIAILSQRNNVELIVCQSPPRQGFIKSFTNKQKVDLNIYIEKLNNLSEKRNFKFRNAFTRNWPDELFVDGTHFHSKGAELFTEFCFE